MLISRQEIAEYMELYQQWYAVAEASGEQLIAYHWSTVGFPLYADTLTGAQQQESGVGI